MELINMKHISTITALFLILCPPALLAQGLAGSEELASSSVSNPSFSLYGLIPGLVVQDKAEGIGTSVAPDMFLRGKSTFGNASNLPLVLVDGFVRNIDDVNLADIESVSVLSDAVSRALYGMQGANGVISIKTRRGRSGRTSYRVVLEHGCARAVGIPSFVGSARYAQYYNEALNNDGMSPKYSDAQIRSFYEGPSQLYPDVRWEEELVRSLAPVTHFDLSADGGNEIVRYYVSIGYRNQTGFFDRTSEFSDEYSTNMGSNRYYVKTNLDVVAVRNLDIKLDITGQLNDINMPRTDQGTLWNAFYNYPQTEFPMFWEGGRLGGTPSFPSNPYGQLNESGYRRTNNRLIQSSLSGEYHLDMLLKGLSVGARYGYDNQWISNEYWDRTYATWEMTGLDETGAPMLSQRGVDGELTYSHSNTADSQARRDTVEAFARYSHAGFDAVISYHQNELKTDNGTPYRTQYYNALLSYNYKDRLIASASLSRSGSESFAAKERYGWYPAASIRWNVTRNISLRTSAGYAGNSNLNARFAYRQLTNWQGSAYYFGETATSYGGRYLGAEANPALRAERSLLFDAGLDATPVKGLSVTVTGFAERRTGILSDMGNSYSQVAGLTYPNINLGSTFTKGFEAGAAFSRDFSGDFGMKAVLGVSHYTNKILSVLEPSVPDDSQYQYQKGHQVGANLALVAIGLFRDQDEIDNSPVQQFGNVYPGDIKYKDVNGDNVINDYDRVYTDAYPVPNTEVSLRLALRFGKFDVSAFLHGQFGTEIYMGDAASVYWPFANNSWRVSEYVASQVPWTVDNAETARYPRLSATMSANNCRRSTFWLRNGDRLRVRSVELACNFNRFRVYLRGMNLLCFDHLDALDPAAMASSPMSRSYHVGCVFNM